MNYVSPHVEKMNLRKKRESTVEAINRLQDAIDVTGYRLRQLADKLHSVPPSSDAHHEHTRLSNAQKDNVLRMRVLNSKLDKIEKRIAEVL